MNAPNLHRLLEDSAERYPERVAAVEPGIAGIDYAGLNRVADRISEILRSRGVTEGDRIGLHLRKSIAALACIFGILKAGAAYVPVDTSAPPKRNRYIFTNCAVRFVISQKPAEIGLDGSDVDHESLDDVDAVLAGLFLVPGPSDCKSTGSDISIPNELAYILYTSGSTGVPKGVMLTHENALAFVHWCSVEFQPSEHDVFSSHAPFYFDLSILDIYVSIKHGARLVLFGEDAGKQPKQLATLIASERISIWYSTPSILTLLLDVKGIDGYDHSAVRIVLFAGEVFPIKHLKALMNTWPNRDYYNLYGPTETNVCTFYKLPPVLEAEQTAPVPIGIVCSGDTAKLMDENDREVGYGEEGELYVTGPSVTHGYWNLPERNAAAFFIDNNNVSWYKTGDLVKQDTNGNYIYIGRRDRMIKRRGYRVELGEIESALYRHDAITEAAVIAAPDPQGELRVTAFFDWNSDVPPSIIRLKQFCMENLPAYMIPDRFSVQPSLPKTATDKVDYQKLKDLA